MQSIFIGFLFTSDSGDMTNSTGNEEPFVIFVSALNIEMQGHTNWPGLQHSDFGAGPISNSPPQKSSKADDDGKDDEEEVIDDRELELTGQLFMPIEGATTFLEAAFSVKLRNDIRPSKMESLTHCGPGAPRWMQWWQPTS